MTQEPVAGTDRPSDRVVEQRVRNRVIEYLELAASLAAQQRYERNVPIAQVPYEIIEQWIDWVGTDPRSDQAIPKVFDGAEVEAMREFQAAWDVVVATVPVVVKSNETVDATGVVEAGRLAG